MTELAAAPVAWYRIRMVWLVLAIPTCTVLGCMLTIYLALSRPDYLVRDPAPDAGAVAEANTP